MIDGANKGSNSILNITNDSWFGPYGEPKLHLALTTFRSIETRLPQLRSTNTGISALVLPDGSIAAETGIDSREVLQVDIPVMEPALPTLLKAWGDWFGEAAALAAALGFACFGRAFPADPASYASGKG